jgi:hypothetical protein
MARYYSPQGNIEIWDEGKQPAGYMTEDEWNKLHPAPEPPLDEVKAAKIDELKGIRDAKEVEPITTDKGVFDYDDKSRDRLSIARQALEDADGAGTITWTTADNQRVPLGVADFAAINAAAAVRSNDLHVLYNDLKQRVNAATTADEVRAIVWPQQEAAANES